MQVAAVIAPKVVFVVLHVVAVDSPYFVLFFLFEHLAQLNLKELSCVIHDQLLKPTLISDHGCFGGILQI